MAFIDLTEADEGLQPYSDLIRDRAFHHRFPIPDVSIPTSSDLVVTILDTIDRHIEQN